MSKKSATIPENQPQETLGEQIRKIADRIKQETHVQIKTTSRILGAAAKMTENYDRLIDEVVDMVKEDLDQLTPIYQQHLYNVEILKQKFQTLREAKTYFGLKANSWEMLAKKLNNNSCKEINISLQPEQEQFIQSQLKIGKYKTTDQVINEALKLLEKSNQQIDKKRLKEPCKK